MVLASRHAQSSRPAATGQPAGALERVVFPALGTQCELQFVSPGAEAARAFTVEAGRWVNAFEAKYSRFRPDSLIGRINVAAGRDWVTIDADAERMFALADQIHLLTRGVLDPTLLPLLRLWNFRAKPPRVPSPDEVSAALAKVGWARVRREPGRIYLPEQGMGLDLGGFGKEYAVDRVAEIALAHGITHVLVDFGHDVRASGAPPDAPCWHVGVEDPLRLGVARVGLALQDRGVASSGNGLRFFEAGGRRYGHIIDPRTGFPVDNGVLQVTVVASSCLEAGLLSTTAFVLGPDEGLRAIQEYFGAEGLIICDDRELQTRGFCQYVV